MSVIQPFIYINGFPGVGKLTIATELQKLLPKAKVVNNHLLIDPAAAIYERSDPEYQPLRKALRQQVLNSIATSTSTHDTTWIFTDQQSSDHVGRPVAQEYEAAARLRGSAFVSIVLDCELEENKRRLVSGRRGDGSTTKLTDLRILEVIRQGEDINHFGTDTELILDVTQLTAEEAAMKILQHLESIWT